MVDPLYFSYYAFFKDDGIKTLLRNPVSDNHGSINYEKVIYIISKSHQETRLKCAYRQSLNMCEFPGLNIDITFLLKRQHNQ